jgi:hypothetical protein
MLTEILHIMPNPLDLRMGRKIQRWPITAAAGSSLTILELFGIGCFLKQKITFDGFYKELIRLAP